MLSQSFLVNNPGFGNCAFYAFAIGLIDIIKKEYTSEGSSPTFDKWWDEFNLGAEFKDVPPENILKQIIDFHYQKEARFSLFNAIPASSYKSQEKKLLMSMQKSLRKIYFNYECKNLLETVEKHYPDAVEDEEHNQFQGDHYNDPINANYIYQQFSTMVNKFYADKTTSTFYRIKNSIRNINNPTTYDHEDINNPAVVRFAKEVAIHLKSKRKEIEKEFSRNKSQYIKEFFAEKGLQAIPDKWSNEDKKAIKNRLRNKKTQLQDQVFSKIIFTAFYNDVLEKYLLREKHEKVHKSTHELKDFFKFRLKNDSKIISSFRRITKNNRWGNHNHLNKLSEIFNVNLQVTNSFGLHREHSIGDISLNNHENLITSHWTTNIPKSNAKKKK